MDARVSVIEKRLSKIKRIICVASGKGGVGKSLVASTLALTFAHKKYAVGLLDLDLYGPSSHIILGVEKDGFPEEEKGIIPPKVHHVSFMSIVYFTMDKPSAFRGSDISNIIIELLAITQWGSLDYLIVDMPPGIGDETLDVIQYLKNCEFLVITTPSKVAMGAVQKLLMILREQKLPLLGVVENMIMKKTSFVQDTITLMNIPYLGAISYDDHLEEAYGSSNKLLQTKVMKEIDDVIQKITGV
jgi:ATP-binding protein involved in chromosome partitioning